MKSLNNTELHDHSEIIERSMEEWSEIFNIERKNYGIKVSKYKGSQSLVYIPDFVNRAANFNPNCAVICQKRLFDKFPPEIKINSSIAFLKFPGKYPGDYSKGPKSYIKQQARKVAQTIIAEDDEEAMQAFFKLLGRGIELDFLDDIIKLAEGKADICGMALEVKNNLFDLVRTEKIKQENEDKALGIRELTTSDWKKIWGYTKLEDGSLCLTSYKGREEELIVPARIGDVPVSSIDVHAFIPWNPRQKRNQVFIEKKRDALERAKLIKNIIIQEGIENISLQTFIDCFNLERLSIPNSVTNIKSYYIRPKFTIYAPSGSFAEAYAKANNIPFVAE